MQKKNGLAAAAALLFVSFRSTSDLLLNPKALKLCRFKIGFSGLFLELMLEVSIEIWEAELSRPLFLVSTATFEACDLIKDLLVFHIENIAEKDR